MKTLNKMGISLVEMLITVSIAAVIGTAAFQVLRSGTESGAKVLRETESDQILTNFLTFRKKELLLTQQAPTPVDLVSPFTWNPATEDRLEVANPIVISSNTSVQQETGSVCHVTNAAPTTIVLNGQTLPLYADAGSGCFSQGQLMWRGYTVNRRQTTALGDQYQNATFVSQCRLVPNYPAGVPNRLGLTNCTIGQTPFIVDSVLPNPNLILPQTVATNFTEAKPIAAALTVQLLGRSMSLKLTAVIPDGKGGFIEKTKEITASVPLKTDPPSRVQIIR